MSNKIFNVFFMGFFVLALAVQAAHGFDTPIYTTPAKAPVKTSGDINVSKLKLSPNYERYRYVDFDTEAGSNQLAADPNVKTKGSTAPIMTYDINEIKDLYGRWNSRCADFHPKNATYTVFDNKMYADACTKVGTQDAIKKYTCKVTPPAGTVPAPLPSGTIIKFGDALSSENTACVSTEKCVVSVIKAVPTAVCVKK